MRAWLDASWSGVTSLGLDLAAGTRDGVEHGLQLVSGVFEREKAAGEDRLEGALGVGSVGAGGAMKKSQRTSTYLTNFESDILIPQIKSRIPQDLLDGKISEETLVKG